jgi:hypothetical protein
MNNYEMTFYSTDGKVFQADVYSVLEAFDVTCHARGHAIKKLLMPGQRGAKGEMQDLDEALVSVSRAIDMARARLSGNGTLTGEPMAEPEPEPEPEPKLVTWLKCVRIKPREIDDPFCCTEWYPSGNIPDHWYPIEAHTQPIETVQQLPEGQEP